MVDAVEKVGSILLERNNRVIGVDFLNRTCAFDPHFESMLRRDPPKIFFRQHRPQPDSCSATSLDRLGKPATPKMCQHRTSTVAYLGGYDPIKLALVRSNQPC